MRTTKRQYEVFKSEVLRLVALWRVPNMRIDFRHIPLEDAYARVDSNHSSRVVTMCFSTDWDTIRPPTTESIKETARHEVVHLIVDPLNCLMHTRYLSQPEATYAVESVVRHLQDLLPR